MNIRQLEAAPNPYFQGGMDTSKMQKSMVNTVTTVTVMRVLRKIHTFKCTSFARTRQYCILDTERKMYV
jgi:hypothetical protein